MTIQSIVIQQILSTNAHLDRRRVAAHHLKVYICGSRNGIAILDPDKTLICLRNACHFLGSLIRQNGRFFFVNTNSLFDEIMEKMATRIGCINDSQWRIGGFLTNCSSPKKIRSRKKKINLGSNQKPDCVFLMDEDRKSSVILEADRLQIPIVSLVDSNIPLGSSKRITYPIPANESIQFVYLFCNLITKTVLEERGRIVAIRENNSRIAMIHKSKVDLLPGQPARRLFSGSACCFLATSLLSISYRMQMQIASMHFVKSLLANPRVKRVNKSILYSIIQICFWIFVSKMLGWLVMDMDELGKVVLPFYPEYGGLNVGGQLPSPPTPPFDGGVIPLDLHPEENPPGGSHPRGPQQQDQTSAPLLTEEDVWQKELESILEKHLKRHCQSVEVLAKYPQLAYEGGDFYRYLARVLAISELDTDSHPSSVVRQFACDFSNSRVWPYQRLQSLLNQGLAKYYTITID